MIHRNVTQHLGRLLAGGLIVMLALLAADRRPCHAAGKLTADITAIDFGTVKEGPDAKQDIVLENVGDATVKIKNIKTS